MGAGYAAVYDLGPTISALRAYGPPEVVTLDDFAGNASVAEEASGYWECVEAVSFTLAAAVAVANRLPRLRWFAGDAAPFAAAVAQAAITASLTAEVTFAVETTAGGAVASGAIVAQMPRLLILPGWTLELDVLGGAAGDAISGVRVYRQRYVPVTLEEYGDE